MKKNERSCCDLYKNKNLYLRFILKINFQFIFRLLNLYPFYLYYRIDYVLICAVTDIVHFNKYYENISTL